MWSLQVTLALCWTHFHYTGKFGVIKLSSSPWMKACSRITISASFLILMVSALQQDHVAGIQQRLGASTETQEVPGSVIILSCCNIYCQNVNKKLTSDVLNSFLNNLAYFRFFYRKKSTSNVPAVTLLYKLPLSAMTSFYSWFSFTSCGKIGFKLWKCCCHFLTSQSPSVWCFMWLEWALWKWLVLCHLNSISAFIWCVSPQSLKLFMPFL